MPRTHLLETSLFVPLPREQVFAFFADAFNLEAITPAFLRFHVVTPRPVTMRPGLLIDYKLRLHRIPIRWRSEITAYDPPRRFVDEQRRGPYQRWRHEHEFDELPAAPRRPAGTMVIDRVTYAHFGGSLVHTLFVRPSLERIFAHRQKEISRLLLSGNGAPRNAPGGMLRSC